MRVVWKYPLHMRGWNELIVDASAKVVLVGTDPACRLPAIWLEHDPTAPVKAMRVFGVFPTGGTIAEHAEHVGSMIDGALVWHIYEVRG